MTSTAKHTLAEIINDVWDAICSNRNINTYQLRHLNSIRLCRTPALGGHLYQCNSCSKYHKRYNSCRNRNCPTCQHTQRQRWVDARTNELLPIKYFHLVFTIPEVLNEMCLSYPRQLYRILFHTSWQTIEAFGWNPKWLGAKQHHPCHPPASRFLH